jgi:nicotinamide-nucleotide amidase
MRAMLSEALAHHPPTMVAQAEIGVVGLTESDAQAIVAHALAELHTGIGFTILARPGDVRILLDVTGHPPNDLDIAVEEVAKALHPHCYTTSGESLPEAVVSAARRGGLSIACAESCTGGLIAAALTDVPGCSDVFAGAAVTYSNESKAALTEVDPTTIATYGAVSTETAAEMARGVRQRLDVDIAVAVSGIAGPGGGTAEKPVGTVCFALADAHGIATERRLFLHGSRQSIRERSTSHALDLLRRSALRS